MLRFESNRDIAMVQTLQSKCGILMLIDETASSDVLDLAISTVENNSAFNLDNDILVNLIMACLYDACF